MNMIVEIIAGQGPAGCKSVAKEGSGQAGELIADFLESDLQGSVKSTQQVLEQIRAIKKGLIPSWQRNGNVYLLTLGPDQITLEETFQINDADNKQIKTGLDEFEDAVRQWLIAIEVQK